MNVSLEIISTVECGKCKIKKEIRHKRFDLYSLCFYPPPDWLSYKGFLLCENCALKYQETLRNLHDDLHEDVWGYRPK